MQHLTFHTHVGADGLLNLHIPVGVSNVDLDVVVVLHPVAPTGWPAGYFEQTYGACADDPLIRDDEGAYEPREPLR